MQHAVLRRRAGIAPSGSVFGGPGSAERREERRTAPGTQLPQIAAKTLDALAGVFEVGGFGGVGNPERRTQAKRRALHHRDAFGFQ
jgi:hypothetical protein